MDPRTLGKYSAYGILLIFTFLYAFGGTNLSTVFRANGAKGTLESEITHNAVGSLESRLQGGLVRQQMTRKDWILFVSYDYVLEFSVPGNIPGADSIDYSLKLPGEITSSNSDREESLYWERLPAGNAIFANTRETRWWLIVLIAVTLAANLINYIKNRDKYQEEQ